MTAETSASTVQLDVPPGFWQREASHYPKPLTPLGSSCLLTALNNSSRKMCEEFGLPLEGIEFREIGGHVYQRPKPFGVADAGATKLPPKFVLWLALRLHPAFRRRNARCQEALRSRQDRVLMEQWFGEWRPKLVADIEQARSVDLAALSTQDLAAHLEKVWQWTLWAIDLHSYLALPYGLSLTNLVFFCRDHLGYNDGQVLALLSGLSEASSEPALALAKLADHIRRDKALAEQITNADPAAVPAALAERNPSLAAAFDDYLYRYSCRALRYELAEECLSERPELVAGLLQDELRRPTGLEAEQERLAAARGEAQAAVLAALPDQARRDEFLALLAEAERSYPTREDNEFYTISVPLALLRFAVLEAGNRLAAAGVIGTRDDVFFLRGDELFPALAGAAADHRTHVAERRAAYAAAEAWQPPGSFGQQPPPPPIDVFPPATRFALERMLYATERVFEPERSNRREDSGAREIKGIAAARGTYTGPARIILGEDQFDRLQPGDVLVCPITSPVWSILFAKVGALVTDSGGVLSHPAIIAREYGIPAVVATGNATQIVQDGQQVVVDGDGGLVRIVG